MTFELTTEIPYGNACDVATKVEDGVQEIAFAPDPHGGPEVLWFCFRVRRLEGRATTDIQTLRLVLKHSDTMLGGHDPSTMRPVIRRDDGAWARLSEGAVRALGDGRVAVAWTVAAPEDHLDVAYCYPYGMDEVRAFVSEAGKPWRMDTIGVSQGARPLIRLSNNYGRVLDEGETGRPGLYVTARQHSGETPGSWVLDGFLRHIAALGDDAPLVWAVPLTNIDGVEGGDYGKDNFPYDLNRAWGRPPMRHETLVFQQDMRRWRSRCRPMVGIDFHAPGACETSGVYTYVPDPETDRAAHEVMLTWANWAADALGDYAAETFARVARYPSRWETPSFRSYGWSSLGVPCITFETPYALVGDHPLTQADYREIGARIARGVIAGIEMMG
jgi:hypothetical protein